MTRDAVADDPAVCVGVTTLAGISRSTPFSAEEQARAQRAGARRLRDLGVKPGDHVLLVSRQSEGGYLLPLEDAVRGAGATLLVADDVVSDAGRVATLIRRFTPVAVLGLGPATLTGLLEQTDLDTVRGLLHGRAVLARPGAYEDLTAAGVEPLRWLALGPALGLEGLARDGVAFDAEWAFECVTGGELTISSRLPRLEPVRAEATGLRDITIRTGTDDVRLYL
jgi:hypothetical protein